MFIGSVLALLSAFTFAASNTMLRRGVMTGGVAQAMAVTVPLGALIGWIGMGIVLSGAIPIPDIGTNLVLFASLAGVIHFVAGRYCNYRAIQAMGANLVAPVQQVSVVITLALAVAVLGELPSTSQMIGIGIVLVCPLLLLRGPKAVAPLVKQTFTPDLKSGYTFAALSAVAFGVSPIFIGFSLSGVSGLTAGLASGAIAYTAATAVVLMAVLGARSNFEGMAANRASLGWYTLSGVTVAASQLLVYMALAIAPVSVVIPIQRTSIIMRFGLAGFFNRDAEVFGVRMLFVTALSLIGAVMIAVDPIYLETLIQRLLTNF